MRTSIYADIVQLGIEHDNHASDLYIPRNEQTTALIKTHNCTSAQIFTNQLNGELWYDIPFAYMPFWEEVENKVKQRKLRG